MQNELTAETRFDTARKLAAYINENGSIPQPEYTPEYKARAWQGGNVVRVYIHNGGKQLGAVAIEEDGSFNDKYLKHTGYLGSLIASFQK